MAWIRCSGSAKSKPKLAQYPPLGDNWSYVLEGTGTVVMTDNEMSIANMYSPNSCYFNCELDDRNTAFNAQITVNVSSGTANGFAVAILADNNQIASQQVNGTTYTFTVTVPAHTRMLTIRFFNAWGGGAAPKGTVINVREL